MKRGPTRSTPQEQTPVFTLGAFARRLPPPLPVPLEAMDPAFLGQGV